jgi:hypothetical protein
MAIGDDAPVRVRGECTVKAELYGCLLNRVDKSILSRAWDKDVVGCHANLREEISISERIVRCFFGGGSGGAEFSLAYLTGILNLAPEDTPRGNLEVRRFGINNHRRLATQLEGDGREMLRCCLCHDASYGSIASVGDLRVETTTVSTGNDTKITNGTLHAL